MSNKVSSVGVGATGTLTRPADTPTYTALDIVGTAAAATSYITFDFGTCPVGAHIIIMDSSLRIDINAVPATMSGFNLHLFNAPPSAALVDDNAFNLVAADRTAYLGSIGFDTPSDLGDTLYSRKDNVNLKRKFTAESNILYGYLQTVGALVAPNAGVFTCKLHGVQA